MSALSIHQPHAAFAIIGTSREMMKGPQEGIFYDHPYFGQILLASRLS
jgi:hypothetical protein